MSGQQVTAADDGQLREAAELITGAAAAWRMPDTRVGLPDTRRLTSRAPQPRRARKCRGPRSAAGLEVLQAPCAGAMVGRDENVP